MYRSVIIPSVIPKYLRAVPFRMNVERCPFCGDVVAGGWFAHHAKDCDERPSWVWEDER
jgi:hypothetical protein